jgi:hypothetical protein
MLEDGEWEKAHDKFDAALDIDAEYAPAYVGLLCAELQVTREASLAKQNTPLSSNKHYKKALRYSSPEVKVRLETYNSIIEHNLEEHGDEKELRKQEQERLRLEREELQLEKERLNKEKEQLKQTQLLEQEQIQAALRKKEEDEARIRELNAQADERRAEKKKLEEEEQRKIEEEQEYRKNQREWRKKGLCFYCGEKLTLTRKCKDCGRAN